MKYISTLFILIAFLISNLAVSGQEKQSAKDKAKEKAKAEAMDQLNQLKATTTVFFYNKSNGKSIDSLKQAISSVWDLTPIIFEDIKKYEKYTSNPKYSYFEISGHSTRVKSKSLLTTNTHYYLVLRMFKEESKRGDIITQTLCRIELFPSFETMEIASNEDDNSIINELYNTGVFYNWSPVLLKAQISAASTNLKNLNQPWLYGGIKSPNLTELLSNDTLYVPEYLLVYFNAFSGIEKKQPAEIFESYKYNYKICTNNELFQIFEIEKRGRLLFEYVKSSSDKFVSIYDLKEKETIYKRYSPLSFNLTSKDLEKIE